MIFNFVAIAINAIFGLLLIGFSIFWGLSLIPLIIIGIISYKTKSYNKLGIMVIFVAILFSFMAIIQKFDPHLFFIAMNFSAALAFLFQIHKNILWIILSWIVNGFSIMYLVTNLRDLTLGIIIGIVIIIIGVKDALMNYIDKKNDNTLEKYFDEENNNND